MVRTSGYARAMFKVWFIVRARFSLRLRDRTRLGIGLGLNLCLGQF
jgi:hypothetical protein